MDFGDDDEYWDPNALEAIELAATRSYAATQQERTQPENTGAPYPRNVTDKDAARESRFDAGHQAILQEKEKYEKLARDKEGELLILKSNILRTNSDHAALVDSLQIANKATRDALTKELNSYKEQLQRLQTDMNFQMQELKETKLKNAQYSRAVLTTSPRSTSRTNGFPDRSAFERTETFDDQLYSSPSRKRRRTTRCGVQIEPLDDFDLAGQPSLVVPECDVTMGGMDQPGQTLLAVSRQNTKSSDVSVNPDPIENGPSDGLSSRTVDRLTLYNSVLVAKLKDEHNSCILNLSQTLRPDPSESDMKLNLGQSILTLMSEAPVELDGRAVGLQLSLLLRSQLEAHKDHAKVIKNILCLLHAILSLFQGDFMSELIAAGPTSLDVVDQVLALSDSPFDTSVRIPAMQLFREIVESLDRDVGLCALVKEKLSVSLCKSTLVSTIDGDLRANLLQSLARLAACNSPWSYSMDILDYISHGLEREEFAHEEQTRLRLLAAQCIYCIIVNLSAGLRDVRRSRHVIPRLIRRLLREVDNLHDFHAPGVSMPLIQCLLKLYYILLKDDTEQVTNEHRSAAELRAAHLTIMTRILYAEDGDGFESRAQDMAMDLLEMAVSPEEGNAIYEVMGNP